MFCSNCGKSIRPEDSVCPHCGVTLGEDRFLGNMYTSSQVRVPVDAPDRAPAGSLSAYTRTNYMSYDNQPEGDVYSNTTYRPVITEEDQVVGQEDETFTAPPAADEAAQDTPTAAEPARLTLDDDQPDTPMPRRHMPVIRPTGDDDDDISTSPLPEIAPRAISPAVLRYMEEAEEKASRRSQRSGLKLRLPFGKKTVQPEEEDYQAEDISTAEAYASQGDYAADDDTQPYDADDGYQPDPDAADAEDGYQTDIPLASDYEYDDDLPLEEEDEKSGDRLGLGSIIAYIKGSRTVQIAIAAVVALVVLILGIRWLVYVTSNLGVKIAGVTRSTYTDGIKLIDDYTADSYRDRMVEVTGANPDYGNSLMNEDMQAILNLLPAEPQENDQTFINTLATVYEGAQNVIKADANAVYTDTVAERAADSANEWLAVKSAVANLKSATTVSQLSAVSSDVRVSVIPTQAPTQPPAQSVPTPEPAATSTTLTQGMKDNAEVERMQRRLIELGYLMNGADGDFGPKTAAALKEFQQNAGLTVDGIATQEVLDALYASDAPAITAASGGTTTEGADTTTTDTSDTPTGDGAQDTTGEDSSEQSNAGSPAGAVANT